MTTITVPPAIAEPEEPEGDVGRANDLAAVLHGMAGRFEEFSQMAHNLRDPSAWWVSPAATAYTTATDRLAKDHEPMSQSLSRVARAVTGFADTLDDLKTAHEGLIERRKTYHSDRQALISDIESAGEVTDAEIQAFQNRANGLTSTRETLAGDIEDFHRRVRENETLLSQALTAADTRKEAVSDAGGIPPLARHAMDSMPGSGATPEEIAQWWEGLSEAEREAVISAYPERIGNTDGLPASARDQANRIMLDDDLESLRQKEEDGAILTPEEERILENAEAADKAITHADTYEMPGTRERPGGMLWMYDPSAFGGEGRVAIGVGNLDTADDVSIQVPGITTNMLDAPDYARDATNLYESARYNGDGSSVATLFWLGYDTPDEPWHLHTVATESRARDGGERLADAVEGLRASRADNPANMTAIGHSYGSTATSYAATDYDLDVDRVALIGSPGTGPADNAEDFSVGAGNVYVGRNSGDFVATLGDEGWVGKFGIGLGIDPSSEDFGAQRFEAESADRSPIPNLDDHGRYYDRDSESLYNLGRIVDGTAGESEDERGIHSADHSYDPWYDSPMDPELWRRDVSENEPGRSDTGA